MDRDVREAEHPLPTAALPVPPGAQHQREAVDELPDEPDDGGDPRPQDLHGLILAQPRMRGPTRVRAVKLREDEVRVPAPDGEIRAVVIGPVDGGARGRACCSTPTSSSSPSRRCGRRGGWRRAGSWSCVPEIYPHGELAGVALEFDDAGKRPGSAGAAATTTAQFDADRVAVLDFLAAAGRRRRRCAPSGFCIGGHLAFRAAFDPRVAATVCFYPTGLHDGDAGRRRDAGSLARAADDRRPADDRLRVAGPARARADARLQILSALYAAGLTDLELHVYAGGEHAFMRDVGARHDPVLTDLKRSLRELPRCVAFGVAPDEVGVVQDWHGGSRRLKR